MESVPTPRPLPVYIIGCFIFSFGCCMREALLQRRSRSTKGEHTRALRAYNSLLNSSKPEHGNWGKSTQDHLAVD